MLIPKTRGSIKNTCFLDLDSLPQTIKPVSGFPLLAIFRNLNCKIYQKAQSLKKLFVLCTLVCNVYLYNAQQKTADSKTTCLISSTLHILSKKCKFSYGNLVTYLFKIILTKNFLELAHFGPFGSNPFLQIAHIVFVMML